MENKRCVVMGVGDAGCKWVHQLAKEQTMPNAVLFAVNTAKITEEMPPDLIQIHLGNPCLQEEGTRGNMSLGYQAAGEGRELLASV